MPDIIKISELDEALALADAAEFPYYQDNGGQNTTFKAPMTQIGAKIVEGLTYQGINLPAGAGNKTVENSLNYLIDGINENKDKVGDLSQLTTADKSSLVGAVNSLVPTAYTNATRSSALSSGALAFVKIGKVVIANLNYTTNTSNVSTHDTVLYSDLPPAVSNVYLNFVDEAGNVSRVRIGTDGKMHLHYSTITANKEINGSFVYLSA